MSGGADTVLERGQSAVAEALRDQWRMFSRVTLSPVPDGAGYRATIQLDPIVVKGSAEQQGSCMSPARLRQAEQRRALAIAECVRRFNASRPAAEQIRDFEVD